MAAMTCDNFQAFLPDMMLDSANVPTDARQHLVECPACRKEWHELQATMRLLDAWEAPAPSPYFDVRMAALLREEKNSKTPGWLERMRAHSPLNGNFHLRPAMTAAFALLLVIGAGSYEGFVSLNRTQRPRPAVSATVNDLELLDSNAQTLQELATFDNTDSGTSQSSGIGSN
jgi:hypothetical protein